jgi:hypothetical protein
VNITWQLNVLLMQDDHTLTAKLCQEEAEFEYHILASASLLRLPNRAAFVVAGKKDDRTADLPGVGLELLDDGSTPVRLLVQDYGFTRQQLQEEPGDRDLGFAVVAVHDENISAEGRLGGRGP